MAPIRYGFIGDRRRFLENGLKGWGCGLYLYIEGIWGSIRMVNFIEVKKTWKLEKCQKPRSRWTRGMVCSRLLIKTWRRWWHVLRMSIINYWLWWCYWWYYCKIRWRQNTKKLSKYLEYHRNWRYSEQNLATVMAFQSGISSKM